VYVVIGPYPVDIFPLQEKFGRDAACALMKKGIDEAAILCTEHQAVAIGEIGRPHFPVESQVLTDSNDILLYGMQRAKDVGVPVVLHTESTTPAQCKEFVEMGHHAGLPVEKIVKHFAPPLITPEENYGLMPSVLSSRKNIMEALHKGDRFLMETDYIDDPRRPGAVLGPRTVPKLTIALFTEHIMTEQQLYKIHVENPQNTYNIILKEK
jgi:TatD-related deoxyribonuclease